MKEPLYKQLNICQNQTSKQSWNPGNNMCLREDQIGLP